MHIKIATGPVSWGVLMKDTPNVPPWEQVLEEMQLSGYTGTELGPYAYLPLDTSRLRDELAKRSLTLCSAFTIVNLVDPAARAEEYEEAIITARFLSQMGCEWIVLSDALFVDANRARRAGRIRPEDGLSDERWSDFVSNTNAFARRMLDEFGLKTVYHPHVGAWVESAAEIERFLTDTDPDLVGFCLDTAHTTYGGADPVDLCRRWGTRIRYLHIKECDKATLGRVVAAEGDYFDGVNAGVFPELGKGSVDFPGLLDVLHDLDYEGWAVVEQDILPDTGADALQSAKANRAYLRQIGMG
ncbi:TIM barrel protein [Anaerolineae bacterium CFX9]|nr:TIM barrel protein [Anaerolineae bacterium CFX9]